MAGLELEAIVADVFRDLQGRVRTLEQNADTKFTAIEGRIEGMDGRSRLLERVAIAVLMAIVTVGGYLFHAKESQADRIATVAGDVEKESVARKTTDDAILTEIQRLTKAAEGAAEWRMDVQKQLGVIANAVGAAGTTNDDDE